MSKETIDGVDFYWRPGCGFCMRLDRSLSKAGVTMNKHNIWDEPAAAAEVRKWARGNETVPTVVIGDAGLVNPTADDVFSVLAAKAPHLVPEDWEPPQPGRFASAARRLLGG
jgi:mycoredoxin